MDFGTRLREARERKGISLRQIAAATKISVAALERLERNDVSKLPGGIFSRSFVRSYAIEVGLDPDETVRQFLEDFSGGTPVSAPGAAPAGRARPAAGPRAAPGPAEGHGEPDFEGRQRIAGTALKLALISLPIAVAIVYFNSRASAPSVRLPSGTAAHAGDTVEHPQQPAIPTGPRAAGSPVSAASPAREPQTTAAVRPAAQPRTTAAIRAAAEPVRPPAPSAPPLTIEIAPTAECWVQLTADGEVVLSRVVAAGEREARQFRDAAVLQVGDASNCAFAINGRSARPLGRAKQVREVRITRENYASFLQ